MTESPLARRSLPSLVSSRICHDLVNPLGAIGNGLELIQMSGRPDGPEMALMSESIECAAARLNFFRLAFGLSGADQLLGAAEARSILKGYFAHSRMKVGWYPGGDVPRVEARLALLLVLCAESALPLGGQVDLHRTDSRWALSATGPRLAVDPGLWGHLTDSATATPPMTAGHVQFALAADAARSLGRPIVVEAGADRLDLRF